MRRGLHRPWMKWQGTILTGENVVVKSGQGNTIDDPEADRSKLKVIVHEAEEGGYWAEVPAIPGCATQGETFEELLRPRS